MNKPRRSDAYDVFVSTRKCSPATYKPGEAVQKVECFDKEKKVVLDGSTFDICNTGKWTLCVDLGGENEIRMVSKHLDPATIEWNKDEDRFVARPARR